MEPIDKIETLLNEWIMEIIPLDLAKKKYIDNLGGEGKPGENTIRVRIYTDRYAYYIVGIDRSKNDGYLGCQVSCRKPYAGENHTRGCDLPDGPFLRRTWKRIKDAIIQHELIELGTSS